MHEQAIRDAHRVWRAGGELYGGWYAAVREGGEVPASAPGAPPLAGQLRVAHSRHWAPCRVTGTGLAGTVVVATPAGDTRAVSQGDYWVPDRPGRPARVGDAVVAVARAGGYETEGWWRTWGGGWDVSRTRPDVTRVYFAVRPDHVLDLARRLPAELDALGLSWSLKIAALPALLTRPDAVVLYVLDADRHAVFAVASGLADLVDGDRCVPLAEPLVPGVCWSEDPGTEESFGQSRCRLLEAAFAGGGDPVEAARRAFAGAGLDPSRPHLRGGRR